MLSYRTLSVLCPLLCRKAMSAVRRFRDKPDQKTHTSELATARDTTQSYSSGSGQNVAPATHRQSCETDNIDWVDWCCCLF